ncbi:MAG: diacylglycerol kinase family protein [Chloroflexota bacterium]|nr:diacylglycerol kinase family protein [Chloroflexota bacterium]
MGWPPSRPPATEAPGRAATLVSSFRFAFAGLTYVARTQRNFRIHLTLGTLATGLGVVCGFAPLEWAVLAGIITLVLFAEMLNTVVEAAVDLASPGYHPLAKVAKDVAAGAVLLTALGAVVAGLCLFGPHLLLFYHR